MDNVVGRLQQISDRIAQIQAQSKLPPSLRGAAAANATAANSASAPSPDPSAMLESAEVDRFQTLLDQALSLSDTDAVSGAVSGALSGATSNDDLQRYQEMLLQAIREASGSNDADA
jgi:hypothetical protein